MSTNPSEMNASIHKPCFSFTIPNALIGQRSPWKGSVNPNETLTGKLKLEPTGPHPVSGKKLT